MKQLAILGGQKSVKIPFPHFVWPDVDERDIKAVEKYMRNPVNGSTGMPKSVDDFEKNFQEFHHAEYVLALNSETSCLHTAFFAFGIGGGDDVLVPDFTFPATALPILSLGANPILVDCQRDTFNINPEDILKKITPKTKALVVTHLWGHPCEMDEIVAICKDRHILLLEDCAHVPGAKYKGKLVGTFGDIGCFSFDNQKLLASGEAGIMIFKNREIYERAIVFSDFGVRPKKQLTIEQWKQFNDTGLAVKYRIHPLAAVVANEKFSRLEEFNSRRKDLYNYFCCALDAVTTIEKPVTRTYVERGGYYGFKPIFKTINRVGILKYIEALWAEGVDIRQTVTPPLHRTALFGKTESYGVPLNKKWDREIIKFTDVDFPNSSWVQDNHLSFATFSHEKEKAIIDQYIEAILKVEKVMTEAPELLGVK